MVRTRAHRCERCERFAVFAFADGVFRCPIHTEELTSLGRMPAAVWCASTAPDQYGWAALQRHTPKPGEAVPSSGVRPCDRCGAPSRVPMCYAGSGHMGNGMEMRCLEHGWVPEDFEPPPDPATRGYNQYQTTPCGAFRLRWRDGQFITLQAT